jgi:MFS family permease
MSTATAPVVSVPLPVGRLLGVGAVIFCANAALLVLQLVAGRLLSPFIGSSLETWTSIIGVFLAGIALGNGFGGKLADRYPSPRTLATLLMIGAVTALWMLVFPMVLNATGLHKPIPLGVRIPILAAVLCLPAGFVLSLLTPLAIKLGLPDVGHTGRVAGLIFALSTLGCLIGNYVTGFYLIPAFTINALVVGAAATLVALACVSLVVVREPGGSAPVPEGTGENTQTAAPEGATPEGAAPAINFYAFPDIRLAYLIVFLASFCGMTLELTASRVLAQQLGVSLYTWTGIIGVMLAGTALGNLCGGLLADRVNRPNSGTNPRYALAVTLCSAAAATVFVFVALALVTRLKPFVDWSPINQVVGWTFSLFFLPMFALGFVSPQVIRLAVPDVAHVGRVAGRVYAWSTVGAIVGTFAAGYVLLSTYGMYRTILGASLVLVLSSLIASKVWENNPMLYLFSIVLGGITGGFILTVRNQGEENVLVQVESNYYTIKVSRPEADPMMSEEDRMRVARRRLLNLDRLLHSVVDPDDPLYLYYTHEHIQVEFLYLARAMLREAGAPPEPHVLVVGGGGYTFPRYAQEVMPESHIDVVEIDPKVTQVAYEHLGLRRDYPHLRPIHMDGRQYVAERAVKGSYDLVIQDAVNDLSVPAHLMTREYNDAVKAALKPDGVYLLTIIDSVADGKLWKAAMATLGQTFPPENVVMLTPDGIPAADTVAGASWDRGRQVMVIYASDKPFRPEALHAAHPGTFAGPARTVTLPFALPGVPGGGPAVPAVPVAVWEYVEIRSVGARTVLVPPERLKPYTDREPGVVLTDQYAPIDNLMAEVFRLRERR